MWKIPEVLILLALITSSLSLETPDSEVHVENFQEPEENFEDASPVRSVVEELFMENAGRRLRRSQCRAVKQELSHPSFRRVRTEDKDFTAVQNSRKDSPCSDSDILLDDRRLIAHPDPLIISTLDGELHAISRETGNILWTVKNDPVLRMPPVGNGGARNQVNMLPNPKDGSLYVINNSPDAKEPIRKLQFTIPELVSASPTRSSDGILYMGKKVDRWMALDSRTGFKYNIPSLTDIVEEEVCPYDLQNPVLIGRSEYTISMMDSKLRNARSWNLTFFDYAAMDLPDEDDYDLVHFTSSSGGKILSMHRSTGRVMHERAVGDLPIVAVYSLRSDGMFRVPFTTVAPETLDALAMNPAGDFVVQHRELFPTLYVGEWAQGLYAVPSMVDESIATIRSLPGPSLPPLLEGPQKSEEAGATKQRQKNNSEDDPAEKHLVLKAEPFVVLGYYDIKEPSRSTVKNKNRLPIQPSEMKLDPGNVRNTTKSTPQEVNVQPEIVAESPSSWGLWIMLPTVVSTCVIVIVLATRWSVNESSKSRSSVYVGNVDPTSITAYEEQDEFGVRIGKIFFDQKLIIGRGCEGTCVFKGRFDNRDVAVKRLLPESFTLADREVNLLRESDQHPNVVRYFCTEQGPQFRYIALELCSATLHDYVANGTHKEDIGVFEILRQATSGLKHLHDLNIVHRDVKPQNVLISMPSSGQPRIRAILSDFGLSKKLKLGKMSCSQNSGVAGTEGWIAPEILKGEGRTTRSVDVFSLGCVYYYVLSDGQHPFGDPFRRQGNIIAGEACLDVTFFPDDDDDLWKHLIRAMIQTDGSDRPTLVEVLHHPAFWTSTEILHFFQDVSDRVEKDTENSPIVRALEFRAWPVIRNDWLGVLEPEIAEDLRKFRSYRGNYIRDLLRALRNKKHHYRELTSEAQEILGNIPDEFARYWTKKFPNLVLHVWERVSRLRHESVFSRYYHSSFSFRDPQVPEFDDEVVTQEAEEDEGLLLWRRSPQKSVNVRGKNKIKNAKKRQSGKSRSDRENWRERSVEQFFSWYVMVVQVAVLTSSGGIPVLTCSSDGSSIPFPILGSLNGIWLFCKSSGGSLKSTENEYGSVTWKEFVENILVICIHNNKPPNNAYLPPVLVDNIIELCYGAMLMSVGTEGLKNPNAESLRKDLQSSVPLIRQILLRFGPKKQRLFAGLTSLSDVIICEEAFKLEEIVENFCSRNETPYGLLTIGKKVAAATSSWWHALTHAEKALFLLFAALQEENGVARDCPVYLPVKSPTVPYRFVSMTLLESIQEDERVSLCLLCGSKPPLSEVMRQVPVDFGPVADLLKTVASNVSTGKSALPRGLSLHKSVFGPPEAPPPVGIKDRVKTILKSSCATKGLRRNFLALNFADGKVFSYQKKAPVSDKLVPNSGGDVPQKVDPDLINLNALTAAFCETREMFTYHQVGLESRIPGTGESFDSCMAEMGCSQMYQNYETHACYGIERWPYQSTNGICFLRSITKDILDGVTTSKNPGSV
ncbi:unnamed protein product [Notodromas monacha]|uniref:non-specific serine/threonine protein kinase n=1 Tax=Notodromas monacha TaxID=399045 RepID=A0A7R9BGA1_9CRUS|nr:unnamed protein product [Notodromas monacha]CAG0913576.1 unnamed protein product [Notodromas monacha]